MFIYFKNTHANFKFHPGPVWNNGPLGFFEEHPSQQKEQQDE